MSFILDALRKSEHDRQRGTGPGIAEVAVTRRSDRVNPWSAVAIGLLLLNLLLLGGWLLSKTLRDEPRGAAEAAAAEHAAEAPTITGEPTSPARSEPREPPPMLAPAVEARGSEVPGESRPNPLADELGVDPQLADEYVDPEIVSAAGEPPSRSAATTPPSSASPGSTAVRTAGGRVVYESQPLDAPPIGSPPPTSAERTAGLPTADEVTSEAGLPELHLDIHVYSTVASERFVFVNGAKYREGEALQAGPTVESITPEGVVLSFRGSRFMLSRP